MKAPVPAPSEVFDPEVVGLAAVPQHTPRAFTGAPPSALTLPPHEAVVDPILDRAKVEIVGAARFGVVEMTGVGSLSADPFTAVMMKEYVVPFERPVKTQGDTAPTSFVPEAFVTEPPLDQYTFKAVAPATVCQDRVIWPGAGAAPGRSMTANVPDTRREIEVFGLVEQRLSMQEVAEELSISPRTVEKHLKPIRSKLFGSDSNGGQAE